MQTFLPYADFGRSAASLDSSRLGKQRVEVLQILRAITFPSYGWTNHPATRMWRGHVPALTSYGLAMVDVWIQRGATDSTRAQIAEFAPESVDTPPTELAMPSWVGNEALHRSHQSNLIRKLPEFYGPQFPGVPDNLEYVWPGTDPNVVDQGIPGTPLMVLRARDDVQLAEWVDRGAVCLGEASPLGRQGPKWRAQRETFAGLPAGTPIAVLEPDGRSLRRAELYGVLEIEIEVQDGLNSTETYLRRVHFDGELERSVFPYPALLQDPRTLFEVIGPAR